MSEKLRTIIAQDAEVDDQNSLRHFMFYANEVELQGIVQTSSCFHWLGVPGAQRPSDEDLKGEFAFAEKAPYDAPNRWTGTDWMYKLAYDYERDYPFLSANAEGYPTPEEVRAMIKIGNVGYLGEMEGPTEGSELIREKILDDDPRTLYLQVWGGMNTIARALYDIEQEYSSKPDWEALHEKITKKIVLTACGEQDTAYRGYIAESWPGIVLVKTLQMGSYAYPWFQMPEGESKATLRASFMKPEILEQNSELAKGYCTWMDGKYYEGEGEPGQYGTNRKLAENPHPFMAGAEKPRPFDFLSEGDSPTFFILLGWGFRTLEDFSLGGIAGRYRREENQFNSKGEELTVWNVAMDNYTDTEGVTTETESMWPFVADIQRSFAARANWCTVKDPAKAEHDPTLSIEEGCDFTVKAGDSVSLHAKADVVGEGRSVAVTFSYYPDGSILSCGEAPVIHSNGDTAEISVPAGAKPGDRILVNVKAQADGKYRLTHYQQVILAVE